VTPQEILQEAREAANAAGDEWMAKASPKFAVTNAFTGRLEGTMLDLCGNAHLQFRDKRSKNYKQFVKAELVRQTGNGVIELDHKYRYRQEHGLHMACVRAAKAVLEKHGITDVRIWDYID
jgi:hypothetical protein